MLADGRRMWLRIFDDLRKHGRLVAPRGEATIEIEDYQVSFDPIRDRFCSFAERKLSLRYLAGELAWYLRGDRDDLSITRYSSFWKRILNDGSPKLNSNYGHALFKQGQYAFARDQLIRDRDTRQACIVINSPHVTMSDSRDKICTNAIMFRIRDNKLNMSVQMRSNDVIYGLGYDAPIFGIIYELMLVDLRRVYPTLEVGRYIHSAASFHIYKRHWPIMDAVLANYGANYEILDVPEIGSAAEIKEIIVRYPAIEKNIREESCYHGNSSSAFVRFMVDRLKEVCADDHPQSIGF